jgi:hypothetical protein
VEKYGEDNAAYLWETLHPESNEPIHRYIELESTADADLVLKTKQTVESEGKTFNLIRGDALLLNQLVNGPWDDDAFLIVPPRSSIEAVYDDHQIMTHVPLPVA